MSLRFCTDCGFEHGGAKYCPRCGASQPTDGSPSPPAKPPDVTPPLQAISDADWFYVDRGGRHGPEELPGIRTMVATGRINRDTLVWREGMPNWVPASTSELAPLFSVAQAGPPRLMGEAVNNTWVWVVAFAPYAAALLPFVLAVILNAGLCLADVQQLKKAGHDTKGMGLMAFLLVPVYLFVRASRLQQSPWYAVVWLVNFLLSLLLVPVV